VGKKRWRDRRQTPVFAFTVQTVNLTLKAVTLFEQPIRRANHLDEKVVFAGEVIQNVKLKLQAMIHSVGAVCLTGFDYNEKIIIRQAMLLYITKLLDDPPSQHRDRQLRQCRVIATYFTDERLIR
jgi:hypothetical protein